MRLAIVGATAVGVATARLLIDHKHDVVLIEKDQQRIEDLSNDLDCAFIHGDGSRPRILREVGAADTQALLCLSDDDQVNIISSLVGRSLGFDKIVTKISDPEFEHICTELSLEHTISADQTTARSLVDAVEGRDIVELSTVLRGDVRIFLFTARSEDEGPLENLPLPENTRFLFAYRGDDIEMAGAGFELREGDDVILLTRSEYLDELRERWGSSSMGSK